MNSTETTPAPAAGGRQIGQVLAGRYRLGVFKGGDDVADVWHALDDSTEMVVTLEILRDRDNEAARQRFLAEARRMAAIERPSVMRVASIHDDAADTFIVFEHLIPLPVVLTGLTGVAKDVKPATKAAEDVSVVTAAAPPPAPTVVPAAAPPEAPTAAPAADSTTAAPAAVLPQAPTVAPSTLSAVAGPTRSATPKAAAVDVASVPTIVDVKLPEPPQPAGATAGVPEMALAVRRSLTFVRPDMSALSAWATRFGEEARLLFGDVRPDALIVAARELVAQRVDASRLAALVTRVTTPVSSLMELIARATALVTSATARIRQVAAAASNARVSAPRAAEPTKRDEARVRVALPRLALPRVGLPRVALPRVALPGINSLGRLVTAAGSLIARVLLSRAVLAAAALIIIAVVVVTTPLADAIVNAVRSASAPSPTAAPTLVPAPFPLPPLSAYGATFESQAAYPTAAPNAVVEWVVALRNTGSAGWYRGIDGAQASLALPDGTGVAVQSTEYVAPGQVGWFVVHLRARAELGTYTVQLLPRIDGRGPLQELGIFTVVTVAKNP